MTKRGREVDSWFSGLNASTGPVYYPGVGPSASNYATYAYPSSYPQAYPQAYPAPQMAPSSSMPTLMGPGMGMAPPMIPARGPGTVTDPIVLDLDSPPRSRSATNPPPDKRQRRAEAQTVTDNTDVFTFSNAPANKAPVTFASHLPAGPPSYSTQPVQSRSKTVSSAPPYNMTASAALPSVMAPPLPPVKGNAKASAPAKSLPGPSAPPSAAGQSQPPTKGKGGRGRAGQPKAPKPEKRLAMMKKAPPQATRERLQRVNAQRFFLVNRTRVDINVEVQGEIKRECREEFQVLGSTGNVYTITIGRLPKCDCPDSLKGNHCKHILFIFAKVLQVRNTSHVWYQKALLTSELEEIFANAPLAPNDVTNPRVRDAYARATGQMPAAADVGGKKRNKIEEGAECAICYEDMSKENEGNLVFCETSCGNALHKQCFGEWARTKGAGVTCPYCREKWPAAAGGSANGRGARLGGPALDQGYINLAGAVGLSPVRDTSTYYHGPRRGQRHYGYQLYDDNY